LHEKAKLSLKQLQGGVEPLQLEEKKMHSPQEYEELIIGFLRQGDPRGAMALLADDDCPLSARKKRELFEQARRQQQLEPTEI
jgi:hypothetical protein